MAIDGIETMVLIKHCGTLGEPVGPHAIPPSLQRPKQVRSTPVWRNLESLKAKITMRNMNRNPWSGRLIELEIDQRSRSPGHTPSQGPEAIGTCRGKMARGRRNFPGTP